MSTRLRIAADFRQYPNRAVGPFFIVSGTTTGSPHYHGIVLEHDSLVGHRSMVASSHDLFVIGEKSAGAFVIVACQFVIAEQVVGET